METFLRCAGPRRKQKLTELTQADSKRRFSPSFANPSIQLWMMVQYHGLICRGGGKKSPMSTGQSSFGTIFSVEAEGLQVCGSRPRTRSCDRFAAEWSGNRLGELQAYFIPGKYLLLRCNAVRLWVCGALTTALPAQPWVAPGVCRGGTARSFPQSAKFLASRFSIFGIVAGEARQRDCFVCSSAPCLPEVSKC